MSVFWRFTIYLAGALVVAFNLQAFCVTSNKLFLSYSFNYIITAASFLWLLLRAKKKSETLGFLFMGISGLKFLLFFLLYKPLSIPSLEKKALFLSFFVPYAICSIYEVYLLSKLLNQKIEK